LSWLSSGINTGNGETLYSTTGMVAQWNFNETSGTTAVSVVHVVHHVMEH
jgi:hypothetical protein